MHLPVPVVGVPDAITREQAESGPFLDRLFAIQVTRGRTCFVTSFSADATYVGVLEGGMYPEHNSKLMQEWVKHALDRHGNPLYVVPPVTRPLPQISAPERPRIRLPWMVCIASMFSDPLDPEMLHSALTVMWWQDPSDEPVTAWIRGAMDGVDWARFAKDHDGP
jgi:hypothetical protein